MVTEEENYEDQDVIMMDENMAAMVLTSLSCSPQSPQFPASFTEKGEIDYLPHFANMVQQGTSLISVDLDQYQEITVNILHFRMS